MAGSGIRSVAASVVPEDPAEDPAAAGGLVGPAGGVLEDLALQGRVELLGEGIVGACAHRPHGLCDAEVGTEPRVVLRGVDGSVVAVEHGPGQTLGRTAFRSANRYNTRRRPSAISNIARNAHESAASGIIREAVQ